MSAALGLYRLQQVDGQIDQIQARQKWIQDTLQNDMTLLAASQVYAAAEAKFKDASYLLKQSEAEVEKQHNKIEQAEASLYGGSVRNPKELQDLQKDIVSLKKYLETLEERELEAMLNVETAQQEFETAKSELERTQTNVNEQNHDLAVESETLLKDLERLRTERKAVISDLAASSVQMYDQLRKQRRGVAVATITDSTCAACGTTLTPAQQQNARSTSQLFNCPTCGRILYGS
ncbi:MAG TPA: C4-type zinc ribbon domain-containing protein [Anaerolineales bacterium]|nr:C4-type zinc ribbon domain-containing protein [Anaerolineales bacterium]